MLFADHIMIREETREEVERRLECWRYALERTRIKVSRSKKIEYLCVNRESKTDYLSYRRSKTEYLCGNRGNDKETVKMEDTKVPRVMEFKYLGSTVQESSSCEREVKRSVQAG